VVVDDYGLIGACRLAVADCPSRRGFAGPIRRIDASGVCWRREA